MKNKILIITSTIDSSVNGVISELNQKGYDTFRLDIDKIILDISYSFRIDGEKNSFYIKDSKTNFFNLIDIDDIHSIWDTGTLPFEEIIHSKIGRISNKEIINFIKVEYTRFILSLFSLFENKFWVNNYLRSIASESKLNNLLLAQSLNLLTPKTIISNSKNDILDFLNGTMDDFIIKTLTFFEFVDNNDLKVCFAKRTKKEQLIIGLEHIYYPLFIQEYIEKKLELRVIVIGKEVFSVAIHSQSNSFTSDDWRTSDVSKLKHEIYIIPNEIKSKLLEFCSISKLQFAAFDFILTPNDNLIFLECNPKGEWYWLEEETKIPLTKSIANLLINRS